MRLKTFFAALGIAMSLVLSLDFATYATSGHSLILGRFNSAGDQTTISRTRPGYTLALFARAGSAPLYVNSSAKVPNLDADLVDGLHASQLATRQVPLRVYTAPPLPGRTVSLSSTAQTVQQVSVAVPAECGPNTRHHYLAQNTAWASGTNAVVRASIDIDSAGVQFGPGFTLTQANTFASLAGARSLVMAPGTHTLSTVADQFSGTGGTIGDPSFVVTDLGYTCSGGPVSARVAHAGARTAAGH